jgi:hypothetical protein
MAQQVLPCGHAPRTKIAKVAIAAATHYRSEAWQTISRGTPLYRTCKKLGIILKMADHPGFDFKMMEAIKFAAAVLKLAVHLY